MQRAIPSEAYCPPTKRQKLQSKEGFNANVWINTLQAAVLDKIVSDPRPALHYREIGDALGLNETCISQYKFKDAMIMMVCEDMVKKNLLKVSETVGWPYVEAV